MGWYLGVIGRINYEETPKHLFIGDMTNGTQNICMGIQYEIWCQQIREFLSNYKRLKTEGFHFLNWVKSKFPIFGIVYPETVNKHDFCYQCSINGPDLFFGELVIIIYYHHKYI